MEVERQVVGRNGTFVAGRKGTASVGVWRGGVLAGVGNRGLPELPRVGFAESEELPAGGRREGGGVRLLHEAHRLGVL